MSRVTRSVVDGFLERLILNEAISEALASSLATALADSPDVTPAEVLQLIEADSADHIQ